MVSVQYDVVWYGLSCYGMVWYGEVWCDMMRGIFD